ncbi:host specificity factor TipJ family phage tail protein [Pseudoalteromonas sp. GW168-MNA-CIBAN-0100]|uniref:host specificity factor TipJ family phage tail protein n=1 Tax=Pseudoalteromonas sp. GW168-MNA-CIBAN-0100 TaxID=3140434 RepID=UPI00331CA30D
MNTQVEVKVYPNKLDLNLYEPCTAFVGQTLSTWLKQNVPAYDDREQPLFSANINNRHVLPCEWPTYTFKPNDDIRLIVEAKDPVTIAYAVIAVIAIGVAIYTANQIPDNYNSTTPDGSSIYEVNTQGNKPKLMGIVPEGAGRHAIFPDYLTMPRREYIDNEQWLYLMLSVGSGEYEILPEEVFIANTPVKSYTGDVFYEIFGPGEDVSVHEGHRNVYTSSEVGSTSGSTGIELKGKISSTGGEETSSYSYSFSGTELIAYIEEYDPEFGSFKHKTPLPFEVGEIIRIQYTSNPENSGYYEILETSISGNELKKLNAQYEEDTTWTGFTTESNSYAKVFTEDGGGDGEFNGPFFAVPEGEVTDQLWLDFSMPQGLGELDDEGDFLTRSVNIIVEYRAEGALEWTQAPAILFSDKTNDQLGKTIPISLPEKIRPEIRVKRSTAANDDTRIYDDVYWTALKAELKSATFYDGMTTLAVRIKGTNALAGSAENKFNLIATRVLPVYENGVWSAPRPTKDIAPFFAHVIKSVGHGDDKIGLEEAEALHNIWSARGDEFNAVFDSATTVFEAVKRILAVGFAEPTIDYGRITPVRDQPRTVFQHMYQPDNYVGFLERSIKLIDDDEPDGVEVEYFSPVTWKSETVLCLLPGDNGYNPEKVRAFGITDKDKAYQFGMRKRRIRRYRRTQFDFKTEMDALNSRYMDYCALADDIPGYEQTGRVEYAVGRTIFTDAELEWQDGEQHILALRKPDGKLSGPYVASKVNGSVNAVVIDKDLDFVPVLDGSMEPPLFMFGITNRWCNAVLITDIKPSSIDKVGVTALLDDVRVYEDDDTPAPDDTPIPIPPYYS